MIGGCLRGWGCSWECIINEGLQHAWGAALMRGGCIINGGSALYLGTVNKEGVA